MPLDERTEHLVGVQFEIHRARAVIRPVGNCWHARGYVQKTTPHRRTKSISTASSTMARCSSALPEAGERGLMRRNNNQLHNVWIARAPGVTSRLWRPPIAQAKVKLDYVCVGGRRAD